MTAKVSERLTISPEDVDPRHDWKRPLGAPGVMNVDFEERVDFRRLHRYRLGRARQALRASKLGALLVFDNNNIRYLTSTAIGEWARDKMCRFAVLAGDGEPHLWDFGSAAAHHRIYAPWLQPICCHAGMVGLRGTVPPDAGLIKRAALEIKAVLDENGVSDMPLGVDVVEPPMLFELQNLGIDVRDGQQTLLDAREIKSRDEIMLLNTAASMVDGAYHMIHEKLKPGVRESDIVANVNHMLYSMGSDDVEAVNAVAGERCSPHPHNFTDRLIRPGDQAFFDIIQSYMGYRTCYYRTFSVGSATDAQRDAYKRARCWMDAAIARVRPGVGTDQIAAVFPKA
jgi:Xaa-Pro dipeptidase